jgi:hypothetical protein
MGTAIFRSLETGFGQGEFSSVVDLCERPKMRGG